MYNLEMLMRALVELLGRGKVGTTYKAVLDNQLILTVKRMDVNNTAITSNQVFNHHMAAVGRLCHPNLVLIRAYFQAKGERLVIYDCLGFLGAWKKGVGRQMEKKKKREREKRVNRN